MKSKKNPKLREHYNAYLEHLGIQTILSSESHGFIIPISPRSDGFVRENVFLIGDAAGFADPVTAEGISNAILSGKLCAEAIASSEGDKVLAKKLYEDKLHDTLLPELRTGVILSKLFYENIKLRNLMLKQFGQQAAEAMTDLFMGERTYPKDYKKSITRRLKRSIF